MKRRNAYILLIAAGVLGGLLVPICAYWLSNSPPVHSQIVHGDTVIEVSWDDVGELSGSIVTYTLRCQLRRITPELMAQPIAQFEEKDVISYTVPLSGTFKSITLKWAEWVPEIFPLPSGHYQEACRLHFVSDEGEEAFGYLPGGEPMEYNYYLMSDWEIYPIYVPLIMRSYPGAPPRRP